MEEKDNPLKDKSKSFAIDIVNTYKNLTSQKKEFVMSNQVLRSGTSIGANVAEANRSQSKADFYAKMGIALKEASETEYWLDILHSTDYLTGDQYHCLSEQCTELLKILTSILKNRPNNT